jgi:acyl-CoA:acyl-CoA alkyltransferase
VIAQLLEDRSMDFFKLSIATLTGGSGAVALVLTDGSFSGTQGHRLLGGVTRNASAFHGLCRWGIEETGPPGRYQFQQFTSTDASAVLTNGIELGVQTWNAFLERMKWTASEVDKVICHQVGAAHRETILKALGIPEDKDFATYPFLGNTGTVALPITAALADGRDFLERGDRVGFLGIGSGLNCLMLGLEW